MFYLTFNDYPGGVFKGQVVDVVAYLNKEFNAEMTLVSFVSLRTYFETRKQIKALAPDAIVVPMYPRSANWEKNLGKLRRLCTKHNPTGILCRGVFAANLALMAREAGACKKVGFDGRGAYAAEWEEYNVGNDPNMVATVAKLENAAVSESDFRVAVSQKLIEYWGKQYGYAGQKHSIIPCTLSGDLANAEDSAGIREQLGYTADDVVLIYSGSTAGWQSFELVEKLFAPFLEAGERHKLLFLSQEDKNNVKLEERFPEQVQITWLQPEQVGDYLEAGDYGILIREDTVTNQVAAPTKFAEYLNAGLKVLISPDIGDYSAFVEQNNCGMVVKGDLPSQLRSSTPEEKQRIRELAHNHFTKAAHREHYSQLLKGLG